MTEAPLKVRRGKGNKRGEERRGEGERRGNGRGGSERYVLGSMSFI